MNRSFIVVPDNAIIPEGIKENTKSSILAKQVPFVIELPRPAAATEKIQWHIKALNTYHNKIQLLSSYYGEPQGQAYKNEWQSPLLDQTAHNRHKLIFTPGKIQHLTRVYKKGRGRNNHRQKYGGGTLKINEKNFNPRIGYEVSVRILNEKSIIANYETIIQMDNKDMIRQEYINHYNIRRYGYGENGELSVPRRNEISPLPRKKSIEGNPLTESPYGLLVNDGIHYIVKAVNNLYQDQKQIHQEKQKLVDLSGKTLPVPDKNLWLSGGWRNPERNEWYSHSINGIHQRGGAVDIIIKSPPGDKQTAIAYWILWNALEANKDKIEAYWQLETNGRRLRADEFQQDIDPRNSIPDAFDKADHLHVNLIYNDNENTNNITGNMPDTASHGKQQL